MGAQSSSNNRKSSNQSSSEHFDIKSNSDESKQLPTMKLNNPSITTQDVYNTINAMSDNVHKNSNVRKTPITKMHSRNINTYAVQKQQNLKRDIMSKCLQQRGYISVSKISNALQGEIFEAYSVKLSEKVVIKKVDKLLYNKRISIQNGFRIVVQEDIVKEAIILHHLTVQNKPIGGYIAKFVDYFEDKNSYYVVMEKAGNMTLAKFTQQVHTLIAEKKLEVTQWKKMVKYIFFQLAVVIYWLHHDMNCCHLDLNLSNIMISNANFILKEDNKVSIYPNFKIKLIDFGLSEIFTGNEFKCDKHEIIDPVHLKAPNVFGEEVYDAKKSDIWSLGVILYQLTTGLDPYKSTINDTEYDHLKKGNIAEIIRMNNKDDSVSQKMINLLSKLLTFAESERIDCSDILKNEWVSSYYNKQKMQIKKKSQLQILKNKKNVKKKKKFPFYKF